MGRSAANVPTRTGLLLVDGSFSPLFADDVVRSALIGSDALSTFEHGLARLRAHVEALLSDGLTAGQFTIEERVWSWTQFVCHCCPGEAITVHSFVLGPPTRQISRSAAIAAMYRLTRREGEAVEFFLEGLSVKEVATRMGVNTSTAKTFLRSICGKMGVSSRSELMSRVLNFSCNASFNCPFRSSISLVPADKQY